MQALIINKGNLPSDISLKYRAHVQKKGWLDWQNSGEIAGTTGQSKRVEAIEIQIE